MTVHHNSHEPKTVVFKLVGEAEGYSCDFFFFFPNTRNPSNFQSSLSVKLKATVGQQETHRYKYPR